MQSWLVTGIYHVIVLNTNIKHALNKIQLVNTARLTLVQYRLPWLQLVYQLEHNCLHEDQVAQSFLLCSQPLFELRWKVYLHLQLRNYQSPISSWWPWTKSQVRWQRERERAMRERHCYLMDTDKWLHDLSPMPLPKDHTHVFLTSACASGTLKPVQWYTVLTLFMSPSLSGHVTKPYAKQQHQYQDEKDNITISTCIF